MRGRVLSLLAALLLLSSCSMLPFITRPYHRAEVERTLQQSGDNRQQLQEVLRHYSAPEDSLKLRAAEFLIANMQGHSFVQIGLYDSTDSELELNVLDWPDYKSLIAAWDSVEAERGELHWGLAQRVDDMSSITTGYLIQNIELSFKAWHEKPWAQQLGFEEFCNYVLPYRGSNEPVEPWRGWFLDRFEDLPKLMSDPSDPTEAASRINDDVKSWFGFTERFYRHPTDQSFSEMLETGLGRCEDMTNLAIYALRANALPVTSDYTPHWADTGNNHAWNAILTPDGRAVPFMGAESNPGKYNLRSRMAKAYRKTFAVQKDNLYFVKPAWEQVPGWLSGRSYVDVTPQYTRVADVTLELSVPVPDSVSFAYLCVFNAGDWKAIHWGRLQEQRVTFSDMGVDIAYLPMYYVDEELTPAGKPLILETDGELKSLSGSDELVDLRLISTTRRTTVSSTDSIEQVFFTQGVKYELFQWQDEWISIGELEAGAEPLRFDQVPAGSLYWLVEEDSRRDERIFSWEAGEQIWW
jgi:hypothetical protein